MFKPRRAAKALGRTILWSLRANPKQWETICCGLSQNAVHVFVEARRLRCLDSLYVEFGASDVWLPFLMRFRIRRAYRQVIANKARHALLEPEVK